MIRLIIILSLVPLSGCVMNKFMDEKLVEVKDSDINEITDVQENTQSIRASFDLDFSQLFGYGGQFTYDSGKLGTLDFRLKLSSSGLIIYPAYFSPTLYTSGFQLTWAEVYVIV